MVLEARAVDVPAPCIFWPCEKTILLLPLLLKDHQGVDLLRVRWFNPVE
jgi:hypothetical protein